MEKTTYQGALCFVLLTNYYSSDHIKDTEVGRACSTYGERRGAYRVRVRRAQGEKIWETGVNGSYLFSSIITTGTSLPGKRSLPSIKFRSAAMFVTTHRKELMYNLCMCL